MKDLQNAYREACQKAKELMMAGEINAYLNYLLELRKLRNELKLVAIRQTINQ